jgi:predicted DNA-binding protein
MLPNAKLTVLWPYSKKINTNNALFSYYLQQAEVIEQPYKSYFDYSFADNLLEKITDVDSPLHNKYIPFSQQNFTDIFAKQLQIECELDRSTTVLPVHYRKAAHNLIAKYYHDQPEIYGYLKTHINILKPDNHETMVDANTLQQWLQQHPNADRNLLAKNFWSLVRHC